MVLPMRVTRLSFFVAVLFFAIIALAAEPAMAVDPASAEGALVVARATPGLLEAVKPVVEIPLSAAELLRLPLGTAEILLSPLPGISIVSGLTNVGAGLLAPFHCAINILSMPYHVVNGVSDACGAGLK